MKGLKGVGPKNKDHICADDLIFIRLLAMEKNEVKSGGSDAWTVTVMEGEVKIDVNGQ